MKRIHAEMDRLASKSGYASRAAFIQSLRTDPKYYSKSAAELMGAAALQAKINDGRMPTLFATLPRLPYGVRAIPAETAEGNITPIIWADRRRLLCEHVQARPASALRTRRADLSRAVPGHHNQIALQQEMNLPDFRKYTTFTDFVEGWGLYSEHLGIEMGIYASGEFAGKTMVNEPDRRV